MYSIFEVKFSKTQSQICETRTNRKLKRIAYSTMLYKQISAGNASNTLSCGKNWKQLKTKLSEMLKKGNANSLLQTRCLHRNVYLMQFT